MQGALYLSIAAIIIKILSAVYRVPYQNIAGDVGFYVYQQIYPIYGIAITLSTYGFPVIISKLVSEQIEHRFIILKNAFISLAVVSSCIFFFYFINAPLLARIMGDEQLLLPLQTVAFIFFIIPFLSVLRGFFQGQEEMLPTAVSQVTEQFFRVVAILGFTSYLMSNGYGPYAAGTGAAFGSVFGGFIGFIILAYFYRKQNQTARTLHKEKLSISLMKTIFVQGVLICFSSLLLLLIQFIDSVTILRILLSSGLSFDEAKITKGVFDRSQPLIQMGTVITTSFALLVVPLIAKVKLEKREDLIQKYSSFAFRVSVLVGGAASVGLAVVIEPTNIMLFKDSSDSIVLAIMGLAIVFTSVFLTTAAILHGLNQIINTVIHVVIGLVVKLLANLFLIPVYGTIGAAVATVVACAVCAFLNVKRLKEQEVLPKSSFKKGINSVFSLVVMAVTTFAWKKACYVIFEKETFSRLDFTLVALSSVSVGVLTFLVLIVVTKLFTEEELEQIPKVRKLAVFMQFKKGK